MIDAQSVICSLSEIEFNRGKPSTTGSNGQRLFGYKVKLFGETLILFTEGITMFVFSETVLLPQALQETTLFAWAKGLEAEHRSRCLRATAHSVPDVQEEAAQYSSWATHLEWRPNYSSLLDLQYA